MNIVKSAIIIATLFSIGCTEDDSICVDCIESILVERNMIEYNGQEIDCKFFLELYHHQNKQFFLLGNHCADLISYPIDCHGNKLCVNGNDSECKDFYDNAESMGIIGIEN